ncbi:hypothetical protein BDQ17DRAFT_1369812, partial [Cyathus striatus]
GLTALTILFIHHDFNFLRISLFLAFAVVLTMAQSMQADQTLHPTLWSNGSASGLGDVYSEGTYASRFKEKVLLQIQVAAITCFMHALLSR